MDQQVIPLIEAATLRPQIDSFLTKFPPSAWASILSGNTDEETQTMLAEFLIDLVTLIATIVFNAVQPTSTVCEADIQSRLGNALYLGFVEALNVEDDGNKCISSQQLTNLVVAEVAENVRSALSRSAESSPENVFCSPRRLTLMVDRACEMLRTFAAKLLKPQPFMTKKKSQTKTKTPSSEKKVQDQIEDLEKTIKIKTTTPSPPRPVSSDQNPKHFEILKGIQRGLNEVLQPFLRKTPSPVLEDLQSESSLEILVVADEIAQLEPQTQTKPNSRTSSAYSRTSAPDTKKVKAKIGHIFTKTYIHGLIHNIIAQVREKFQLDSKAESEESVKSLMSSVDALFLTEVPEDGKTQDVYFPPFDGRSISPQVVKDMADQLFYHVTSTNVKPFEFISTGLTSDEMYEDIQDGVKSFIEAMNWWLTTGQDVEYSGRMMSTLMQILAKPSVSEEPTLMSKEKMLTRIMVEKLIARIFRKARTNPPKNVSAIIDRLHTLVWNKCQNTKFIITEDNLRCLDKIIYKEILKSIGSKSHVLSLLKSESDLLDGFIMCGFQTHLTVQRSGIRRFFSSIASMFRR